MFFTFEIFKTAYMGDMKLCSSCHRRHRRRRYRRHRCSRSIEKTMRNDAKGKMLVVV
jgi:hypothetical protein